MSGEGRAGKPGVSSDPPASKAIFAGAPGTPDKVGIVSVLDAGANARAGGQTLRSSRLPRWNGAAVSPGPGESSSRCPLLQPLGLVWESLGGGSAVAVVQVCKVCACP